MQIVRQKAEFLSMTHEPWREINRAARVSHASPVPKLKDTEFRFVQSLVKAGHLTPIEFVHLRFRLVTDRAVANELTRHRVGVAFVQRSTRYCDESDLAVIEPPVETDALASWAGAVEACESAYKALLDAGVRKELARSVLPLCLATELMMDVNLRELRSILKLRTAPAAHPQMRELMALLLDGLPLDVREIATMEGKE